MCGIGGFVGVFDPDVLKRVSRAQRHRGPDDEGVWIDQDRKIGLCHQRLSIIDLSQTGHQPMHSDDGRVVIVYNGEIYNFRELRAELQSEGIVFRGSSDTEVLLNLYIARGEEMLSSLNGIFAFAIWDQDKQELFIARDGLGVKPLYYAIEGTRFAFASEIKGLLQLIPEAKALDVEAIHRYLTFLWCPGTGTPLKAVRKLLPGEAIVLGPTGIKKKWNWYELPVFRRTGPALECGEAVAGTREHLRTAVRRQMIADVPVGAFLSGGLDSSAVVAFAREVNPDIQCYTIETTGGAEDGMADDLPYARRVAEHLNVSLEVVEIDSSMMAAELEAMVSQLDEPLADPAPLNVRYISQLARENGIKVLLSGAGGDDLFTGYRRHWAVQLERYWTWLPKSLRSGLEFSTSRLNKNNPFLRRVSKLFNGASLDGASRLANYFFWIKRPDLMSLYSSQFAEALVGVDAAQPMKDFLAPLPDNVGSLDRMLALEQRFFLCDHNLTYTDKMSMAEGIEARVPFLDLELVDYASRIPSSIKQRGRAGKWVLKKAMEPYLPKDVIYRPKSGFGAPLRRWMRYELRELLGSLLSEESLRNRGIFNPKEVHNLIAANDDGRVDASYTLLSMLCIEIWCRKYIDS